jgi:hypothetical protein
VEAILDSELRPIGSKRRLLDSLFSLGRRQRTPLGDGGDVRQPASRHAPLVQ